MISDILKRANTNYVSNFVLFGSEPIIDEHDKTAYDDRIEKARKKFSTALKKESLNIKQEIDITDIVCELLREYEEVFFEVGMRAGIQISAIKQWKEEDILKDCE